MKKERQGERPGAMARRPQVGVCVVEKSWPACDAAWRLDAPTRGHTRRTRAVLLGSAFHRFLRVARRRFDVNALSDVLAQLRVLVRPQRRSPPTAAGRTPRTPLGRPGHPLESGTPLQRNEDLLDLPLWQAHGPMPAEGKQVRSLQRKAKKLAKERGQAEADVLVELLAEAGLEETPAAEAVVDAAADRANGKDGGGDGARGAAHGEDDDKDARTVSAVVTSHPLSRDVHVEQFTLLFHGHELLMDAKVELNHGRCAACRPAAFRMPPAARASLSAQLSSPLRSEHGSCAYHFAPSCS